mgnify:CR=1 FL=1
MALPKQLKRAFPKKKQNRSNLSWKRLVLKLSLSNNYLIVNNISGVESMQIDSIPFLI